MFRKKVLIVYASSSGATEGIVKQIEKTLDDHRIKVDIINAREKSDDSPDLSKYDGILFGTGIYVTAWIWAVRRWFLDHLVEIKQNELKLAVFVSCIHGFASPKEARRIYIRNALDKRNIHADIYEAFGPVLDFSSTSRLNFLQKGTLKVAARGLLQSKDVKIDFNGSNDLRNWYKIREFAKKFAAIVKE